VKTVQKQMRSDDAIRSFVSFTVGKGLRFGLRRSFDGTRKPEFR
jgi:hypothetical protein